MALLFILYLTIIKFIVQYKQNELHYSTKNFEQIIYATKKKKKKFLTGQRSEGKENRYSRLGSESIKGKTVFEWIKLGSKVE